MANTSNNKIVLAGLDFDAIKLNLQTWLQSQPQFTDFNFEGPAITQLLNLLAINTKMLAFYMNMVASEMFLDTSVLYPNIVSHAKLLSYIPRSATADQAVVNVAITRGASDNTTSLTLPAYTQFSSAPLNGQSFNFVTVDNYETSNVGSVFTFVDVVLKEGQPTSKTFIVNNETNPTQIFDLSDANVDISTLQVVVQVSATNLSKNTFTLSTDATNVSSNSNVYYLDQDTNGNYQIYFGDNIIGSSLNDGNLIIVTYIQTSGGGSAGVQTFALGTQLLAGSVANVTTVQASAGGSGPESAQSIKFNAPLSYIAQNRAVTVNDYISLVNKNYPYFDAVTVWGGDQNVPPVYGKVFVSAKPKDGFAITVGQQQFVIDQVLIPMGILTVIPEWVDADYNFLNFRVTVFYNPTETNSTANQMSSIVSNAIDIWANNNLNQFNSTFQYSRLLRAIDDADPSIEGSDVAVFIQKRFDPTLNVPTTYTLTLGVPLFNSGGTGANRLYSAPSFTQNDSTGIPRQCYVEETPGSSTGLESVNVLNPGNGYTSPPTLVVDGDGSGANAYSIIVNGQIQSVIVDAPGADYTTATVLVIGDGSGATLQAITQGATGNLRSYFFDVNNVKNILQDNIGEVDYVNGIITLTNFKPSNVANPSQTLSLYIAPLNNTFGSTLNRLITFDTNDPGAIAITINSETD